MAPRGLDSRIIVNIYVVVERMVYEIFSLFEASLANRVKYKVKKAFHRDLWSWSLLSCKRVG